jgi:hypothetical protein
MVGREVSGYGEQWSVVAVVTRGKDDRGRPVSLYRYFLTPTVGAIEGILRWMVTRQIWVFDPFDSQILGQPHRTQFVHKDIPLQEHFRSLVSEETPIVIPATIACNPLVLNRFTQELQSPGGMAWAYNVAALERPEYFQAIYPMDAKAEGILRQARVSRAASGTPIPGDTKIQAAIKAFMNGRLKTDHVEVLENALKTPEIDEKYWTKVLDKQGASQARSGGLYSERNIRLLTLKAIVVPKSLPDFLLWLNQSKDSESHGQASYKAQLDILKKIGNKIENIPEIGKNLEQGLCHLIPYLVQNSKILEEACVLLESQNGLWWSQFRKSLYPKLENDLELMRKNVYGQKNLPFQATQYPEWKNFLSQLTSVWQFDSVQKRQYLPLAEWFEAAKTPKLAAFFYQVSKKEVPKALFFRVSNQEWYDQLFGIRIRREMDWRDVVNFVFFANVNLGGIDMNRLTAILLFAVVFVIGGFGGSMISDRSTDKVVEERTEEIEEESNDKQDEIDEQQNEIESWEIFANHIDRTKPALEQLQENLTNNLDAFIRNPPQELPSGVNSDRAGVFIHFLKEVLATDEVPYEMIQHALIFQEKEHGDNFIKAVKAYQERNELEPADGIIDSGRATSQKLEADIREELR